MHVQATVLVLEDNPATLLDSIGVVEDAGFTALGADTSDAARGLLREYKEIGVAFADLDAPGCDELLADMRQHWPAVRVVLTATTLATSSGRIPHNSIYVPKPFSPADLEDVLWKLAA